MKIDHHPIIEISAKSFFTMVFFTTMRIMLQQQKLKKEVIGNPESSDIELSVLSDNTLAVETDKDYGFWNKVFVASWCWILVLILFAYGFVEKRITLIKIVYMGLFLFFNISFQVSDS